MLRLAKHTKIAALALAAATLVSTVPASAGWHGRGHGWGGPGYYYGPRYRNNGGAVAAGIIGGLALGAIAAQAYNQPRCWIQTQTFYNRWGEPYYRDVQVCR